MLALLLYLLFDSSDTSVSSRNRIVEKPALPNMAATIALADYLFLRLHQLGLRSLHGVPGDYNLVALDYVEKSGTLLLVTLC